MKLMSFNEYKKWLLGKRGDMTVSPALRSGFWSSYFDAIKNIDKYFQDNKIIENSLNEISDLDDLENLRKVYFKDKKNIELDVRGNGMYKAAFIYFLRFKNETNQM